MTYFGGKVYNVHGYSYGGYIDFCIFVSFYSVASICLIQIASLPTKCPIRVLSSPSWQI